MLQPSVPTKPGAAAPHFMGTSILHLRILLGWIGVQRALQQAAAAFHHPFNWCTNYPVLNSSKINQTAVMLKKKKIYLWLCLKPDYNPISLKVA